jgi:hypothetical protein
MTPSRKLYNAWKPGLIWDLCDRIGDFSEGLIVERRKVALRMTERRIGRGDGKGSDRKDHIDHTQSNACA